MTNQELAEQRVRDNPELQPYEDVILHEWEREGDDHWQWVAEAPIAEILDWAQVVEISLDQEQQEMDDDAEREQRIAEWIMAQET